MKGERYYLLDVLRGMTLLSMVLYHGVFDMVELYGVNLPWFWKAQGYIWQQSICWMFILLSGFCWSLGSRPWKRGLVVFGGGLVITMVTSLFLPEQRVLFGILTFTGTAMLALVPLKGILEKIFPWTGLAVSGLLFLLTRNVNEGVWGFEILELGTVPEVWYRNMATTFLGFPEYGFFSGDYFSFFPWIFLYLCGYFLHGILLKQEKAKRILSYRCPALEWAGRNSLLLYMLHQPVLVLALSCIF